MNVCKECLEENFDVESGKKPFPSYSILSGFIGVLCTVFTGNPLLIPLALFPGVATDLIRCDFCGSQVGVHKLVFENPDSFDTPKFNFKPADPNVTDESSYVFDEQKGHFVVDEPTESISDESTFDESAAEDSSIDSSIDGDFGFGTDSDFGSSDGSDFGGGEA